MFEKIVEKFSLSTLFLRLIASLRTTNTLLAEMADTQKLTLRLKLLEKGLSIEELRKIDVKVDEEEREGELVFTGESELIRWEVLSQKFIAKFNAHPPVDATAEWLEEQVDV